LSKIQRVK
jgi:hypothetical protein